MYYLCKVFDNWTLYDPESKVSRQLSRQEVEMMKSLFPALFKDSGKMLEAVQVNTIHPNKLMHLTASAAVVGTTGGSAAVRASSA